MDFCGIILLLKNEHNFHTTTPPTNHSSTTRSQCYYDEFHLGTSITNSTCHSNSSDTRRKGWSRNNLTYESIEISMGILVSSQSKNVQNGNHYWISISIMVCIAICRMVFVVVLLLRLLVASCEFCTKSTGTIPRV